MKWRVAEEDWLPVAEEPGVEQVAAGPTQIVAVARSTPTAATLFLAMVPTERPTAGTAGTGGTAGTPGRAGREDMAG
jgi:hypothetical protein